MNCPIIEETADGISVGRCSFYLSDGKTCDRHGDVSVAIKKYNEHGICMKEREFNVLQKPDDPTEWPCCNELIRESDESHAGDPSKFCFKCGSSLKRKWFIRTSSCIQPECSNYWEN